MIVKSVSHSSNKKSAIKKLINYVFEKEKLVDQYLNRNPLVQKKFLQSFDKDKWVHQFKKNDDARSFNHKKRTVLRHEIIAFAPEDNKHLTRETLQDFIHFYFKHRSPHSKVVAGVHYERSVHIHFVHSAVGVDTKSTRVSRDDFKKFKVKLQEFQREKYPELSNSIVNHSKSKTIELKRTQKEQQMRSHRGLLSDKEKLSKVVKKLASECKSLEELAKKLHANNYRPYYRNGKLTGIWMSDKRKLRLITLGVSKEHLKQMSKEQLRLDGLQRAKSFKSRSQGRRR